MSVGELAGSVGRGLVAGLFGTGVMTAVQSVEMKLQGRGPSATPAEAAEKVLGIEVRGEEAEQRLAQAVHFAYGTAWGGVRGLLGGLGLSPAAATPAHLGLVFGAAAAMLPRLGLAPPIREWSKKTVAMDLLHHVVYVAATTAAYEWLERRSRG